jgi:hypothetical protein
MIVKISLKTFNGVEFRVTKVETKTIKDQG